MYKLNNVLEGISVGIDRIMFTICLFCYIYITFFSFVEFILSYKQEKISQKDSTSYKKHCEY